MYGHIRISDNFGHSVTVVVKWDGTEDGKIDSRREAWDATNRMIEREKNLYRNDNLIPGCFVAAELWD